MLHHHGQYYDVLALDTGVQLDHPDLNVVELRGREEDLSSIGGVVEYLPEN